MSSIRARESTFFTSPRNQRRFLIAGGALFVTGVVAVVATFAGNTANTLETPLSNVPAQTLETRKTVPLDPAARRVVGKFILTAVARKNLDESWNYVHPDLRAGYTRKRWRTGNIPVVYFPSAAIETATFDLQASYADEVLMRVALVPKEGTGVRPTIFNVNVKKVGRGAKARWLVSYWAPYAPPAVPKDG